MVLGVLVRGGEKIGGSSLHLPSYLPPPSLPPLSLPFSPSPLPLSILLPYSLPLSLSILTVNEAFVLESNFSTFVYAGPHCLFAHTVWSTYHRLTTSAFSGHTSTHVPYYHCLLVELAVTCRLKNSSSITSSTCLCIYNNDLHVHVA